MRPAKLKPRARLLLLLCCGSALAAGPAPQPPSVVFGDLFKAVQLAALYPDSKTFADAVPNQEPAVILSAYRQQRSRADFDLRAFVDRHFTMPAQPPAYTTGNPQTDICAHIDSLWPVLTRAADARTIGSSLLPLPH